MIVRRIYPETAPSCDGCGGAPATRLFLIAAAIGAATSCTQLTGAPPRAKSCVVDDTIHVRLDSLTDSITVTSVTVSSRCR